MEDEYLLNKHFVSRSKSKTPVLSMKITAIRTNAANSPATNQQRLSRDFNSVRKERPQLPTAQSSWLATTKPKNLFHVHRIDEKQRMSCNNLKVEGSRLTQLASSRSQNMLLPAQQADNIL